MVKDAEKPNLIKGCSFHNGLGYGLFTKTSSHFQAINNVFHGFVEKTVAIFGSYEFNFTGNYLSYTGMRTNLLSASKPSNYAF